MLNLKDIGDRKTMIRGTKGNKIAINVIFLNCKCLGAMVLLPVPIENTMTKLVETLPNATSLTLLVDTHAAGFKLVCLPKVRFIFSVLAICIYVI